MRDSKAIGWNAQLSSGCSRMAETAGQLGCVGEQVRRMRRGPDAEHWGRGQSCLERVEALAGPQRKVVWGLHRAVSLRGAAREEKHSKNLL